MKKITLFLFAVMLAVVGIDAQGTSASGKKGISGNGYYRIRNLGTGRYLRVWGNIIDATQSQTFDKIFVVGQSVMMADPAKYNIASDPGTVLKITGTTGASGNIALGNIDVTAQTVGLKIHDGLQQMIDVLADYGVTGTYPDVDLEYATDQEGNRLYADADGNATTTETDTPLYMAIVFRNIGQAVQNSDISGKVASHFGISEDDLNRCENLYFVDRDVDFSGVNPIEDENGEQIGLFTVDYRQSQRYQPTSQWVIEPVNEEFQDECYFSAAPKATATDADHSGKYYTTMYTEFPYQLLDGIKAYYVSDVEESEPGVYTAVMKEIADKVPALTPVLLECASSDPASTRLLPIYDPDNTISPITDSVLKGVIDLNMDVDKLSGIVADEFRTEYDADNMMVFGIATTSNTGGDINPDSKQQSKLGFYSLFGQQYLTSNKAYLDITNYSQVLKADNVKAINVKVIPADQQATAITDVAAERAADNVFYNLAGQRVASPVKGIYILNGKKIYVK